MHYKVSKEERHEIIQFSPEIPVKVFTHKLGIVKKHWHSGIELLFVLNGIVRMLIDGNEYELRNEDVILINSNSIHELSSEGAVIIALQIDLSKFTDFGYDLQNIRFDCVSTEQQNKRKFEFIKKIIAKMILEGANETPGKNFRNISYCYLLLSFLVDNFYINDENQNTQNKVYLERLRRVLNYLDEHYKENLSLNEIASRENLSVPYFSSFFRKYMGVNFTEYYTVLKLNNSLNDLVFGDDSIENIAAAHGFTEPHAYVRAFKKYFNTLPSLYRKEKEVLKNVSKPKFVNYLNIEDFDTIDYLEAYLHEHSEEQENVSVNQGLVLEGLDPGRTKRRLQHSFKKFTTVGRARELLDADIQLMLTDLQTTVGYEFIKFHGLLSDDMMICSEKNGEIVFNFLLVDKVFDFLLSIKLKPLVQLSFMPELLASDPGKRVFQSSFIISPPKDYKLWNRLVRSLLEHLEKRYGKAEMTTWLYSVWNEPDTAPEMFGFNDVKDFYALYNNTFRTVKDFSSELKFGTPSMLLISEFSRSWAKDFFKYIKDAGCDPDFINIHYYSDQFEHISDNIDSTGVKMYFPKDSSHFSKFISQTQSLLKDSGFSGLPVYLTEWNFSVSHRHFLNDTCFKSCYIMKNLLENYDRLDSFGYWHLTDLIYEKPIVEEQFHGGMGIYTNKGVRKNVFYAFDFAGRLGDNLVEDGDGYFITESRGKIIMISYNYLHFSDDFAAGRSFNLSPRKRYEIFNMNMKLDFSVHFINLENEAYTVKEYYVNINEGSSFDIWNQSGGLQLSERDLELLKQKSAPGFHQFQCRVNNGELQYVGSLEPLEIRLTEIVPI